MRQFIGGYMYVDGNTREDMLYIVENKFRRYLLKLTDISEPQNGPVFIEIFCKNDSDAEGVVNTFNYQDKAFHYEIAMKEKHNDEG